MTSSPDDPTAVTATRRSIPRPALLIAAAALAVAAATSLALPTSRDTVLDGMDHSADFATDVTWLPLLALALCTGLYYVAAGGALRASTTARVPFGQAVASTLSASAANRLTPAGLGGSAVMARFLTRRGGVPASESVGAVAVVAAARAVAAGTTLLLFATVGPMFGMTAGRSQLTALGHRVASPSVWPWAAGIGGALVVGLAVLARRHAASRLRGLVVPLRAVAHQPMRLGRLLGCSAAQSILLAIAFAAATLVAPGPRPEASLGALMAGYLIAAAVAAAIPIPGGLGSAEAALTAVLVAAHVPLGHALVDVTVFRVVTLWVPSGLGVLCAGALRRRGSL